ncbi:DEAD/DEAH box helicase, partial [Psychrobacter sp. T6-1]
MTDILSTIAAQNGIIDSNTTANTATQAPTTDAADSETTDENQVTFKDLNIAKPILTALDRSGYTNPTPIQAQAIPFALEGRDLLLSAQTGSGKTAAFVIPVLDRLSRSTSFDKLTKALILTPTRELAQQVHDSVRTYSKDMRGVFCVPLVGGAPYNGQITALKKGVQVIVATPGRLLDHINAGRVDLSSLEVLVLDEADRMLDMGFADDISDILKAAPTDRQTIMCSATWDGPVGKIAASFTKNPERVSIKVESAHIDETVYYCDDFNHKNKILDTLVCQPEMEQIIIFAATKRSTEKLAKSLQEQG